MPKPLHSSSDSPAHIARYEFALPYCEGKTVLDLACGDGYGSKILAEKARKVCGVDNDPNLLRQVPSLRNADFVLADARSIPYADNNFDVVVSFETIEHFTEQKQFLDEICRVLKPGGFAIISTPDHDVQLKLGAYNNTHDHGGHGHPGELRQYEFTTLLAQAFGKHFTMYGQFFLTKEPSLKHKIANLAKRIDFLHLRRKLLQQSTLDKMNVSRELIEWNAQVSPLSRHAAQMIGVCHKSTSANVDNTGAMYNRDSND
jgi:ubiquinone/menaquinone biosynthesis C-methylase UbiE